MSMATLRPPRLSADVRPGRTLGFSLPLTERVLGQLGSPRWLWILLCGLSPAAIPFSLFALLHVRGEEARLGNLFVLLLPQAVLGCAVILVIWGIDRLVRQARALQPELLRLTPAAQLTDSLPGMASTVGPLLMSAPILIVSTLQSSFRFGWVPSLVVLPLRILTVVPLMTFVWTYLTLLIRLDRLGGYRLTLKPFPHDRSLGLGAVGSLAFTGFWLLFAATVPIMFTSGRDTFTLAISLAVVIVGTSLFFLSMWRLHRQMANAKALFVVQAGLLYAAAYEPLRAQSTLEVLGKQAPLLAAAQALEKRAQNILEWPIDERVAAIMGFIVAGVCSGLIVRFVVAATKL